MKSDFSPGAQGGRKVLRILHIRYMQVRKKRPRGFERTPGIPDLVLPGLNPPVVLGADMDPKLRELQFRGKHF